MQDHAEKRVGSLSHGKITFSRVDPAKEGRWHSQGHANYNVFYSSRALHPVIKMFPSPVLFLQLSWARRWDLPKYAVSSPVSCTAVCSSTRSSFPDLLVSLFWKTSCGVREYFETNQTTQNPAGDTKGIVSREILKGGIEITAIPNRKAASSTGLWIPGYSVCQWHSA